MSDATFSPLNNSELESGVVTVTFNQLKESIKGAANKDESASADIPGNSSVITASFNFINSIVGAGIIGIPYAIQRCGFVSGVIMLAYVAYLVYQSVTMLIDCGVKAKKLDFEELAEHLLGRSGYYAALVFMFLFAYGAQVAYLVVIGDTIPVVAALFLPDSIFANRNITIALMSTIIVLPLCLLKDLSSLSWTSMLSIAADIALVLIVLIAAPAASASEGIKHGEVTILNSSIFVGIGTMSFAFVCQHNSFIVFRTLKEKTSKNWEKVAKGSIFFSFLMCSTLGIAVSTYTILSVRITIAAACSICRMILTEFSLPSFYQ
jgi:solute carrier family 38 (sodium-coupled neutral amino acid transporter), member 11